MHILFLSDNFYPETNAPAIRTNEHCAEWVLYGHKVTVITSFPNFPKGKLMNGYSNKLFQIEEFQGIRVIRVWTFISPNKGFVKRTLDFISFMISSFIATFFVRNVNVIVGTSPQFFTIISAFFAAKIKRIPWVFELRDIWPESIRTVGVLKNNITIRFLEKLELFLYKKADLIICVTKSFKKNLITRNIDPHKIKVVTNGVNLINFRPEGKNEAIIKKNNWEEKFIVGYIGTHGLAHGLDTILRAAEELIKSNDRNNYLFLFIGDGAEKENLVKHCREAKLNNVIFMDTLSRIEIVKYWSILDASIIHLKDRELFRTVIPSKLFEAIGMNTPVLLGIQGEAEQIVLKEKIGIPFKPEDTTSFLRALMALKENPVLIEIFKKNAQNISYKYDRKIKALKMLTYLEKLEIKKYD